ncbi:MAG: hypothetical protein ACMUHM_02750 [Thermoplasmatota archaeon]
MKRIVLLLSLLLVFPFISMAGKALTCESCHSSSSASGGYVYKDPVIKIVHDPFYSPGQDFQVALLIRPQPDYSMKKLSAELTVQGSSVSLISTASSIGILDGNGDIVAEWTLKAGAKGEATITIDFSYEVYFRHGSAGNKDTGSYQERRTAQLLVSDLSLGIHPGSVLLSNIGETGEVVLEADAYVHDIEIRVPQGLDGVLQVTLYDRELFAGESTIVTVELMTVQNRDAEFTIAWVELSGQKEVNISVSIVKLQSTDRGEDPLLKIGQYSGIAAFILLVIGYFTGGTGLMKKYANLFFRHAKRRVRFHCALSYLVLILAFYHLASLWYGPYRAVVFESWEIVLGEVAVIIMILISVNGIFQKRMIKWWGFHNWKRIHAWGSYLSTSLVTVHLLTYGTHFLWFRELVGMQ